MKILIVSYYFPPFNAVGAIRIGKLAKYLSQAGHEIKILSADNQLWAPTLPVEIEESSISRTSWFDINKPIQLLLGGKKNIAAKGFERAGYFPKIITKMGYYYKNIVNFPDGQIGWYPFAVRKGKKLLDNWKPDFIFSSSSPPTSFLIARKLSQLYGIPWIADFRDLWVDNHNADLYQSTIRRLIDQKLEKWTLATASAFITVSEPLADILKSKFSKPVGIIPNGYDLDDYPLPDLTPNPNLKIVYTGIIHPIKRDPAPLFEAISLLGEDGKNIQIDFYGRSNDIIKKAALQYGIGDRVNCHDTVPYTDSLKLQVNADVLLLLTYNSDKEKGVITSKFFEYLGAKRPILLVGCINGVAANIINERKAGYAENDPVKIAEFLKDCLATKKSGKENQLSTETIAGFSRQEQASALIKFLEKLTLQEMTAFS